VSFWTTWYGSRYLHPIFARFDERQQIPYPKKKVYQFLISHRYCTFGQSLAFFAVFCVAWFNADRGSASATP
jgi:hypothetical protein